MCSKVLCLHDYTLYCSKFILTRDLVLFLSKMLYLQFSLSEEVQALSHSDVYYQHMSVNEKEDKHASVSPISYVSILNVTSTMIYDSQTKNMFLHIMFSVYLLLIAVSLVLLNPSLSMQMAGHPESGSAGDCFLLKGSLSFPLLPMLA